MSRLKELRKYVDADVTDHCLKDASKEVKDKERARFERLCGEFGL